ncbi:MAG: amidohydrolase [Nitriliruptorales bacterium]|nr:amidohydrolase [Nitriliruptorales bacterium]
MRIALAQTNPVLGDLDTNLVAAKDAIAAARAQHADVVIFPELSLTGYAVGTVDVDLDLEADDPRLLALAELMGDGGVLFGFQEAGGVHSYNSAAYYEGGRLRHVHRKLYLPTWGLYEERKHFSPGQSMRAYDTRWGRMATLICNDAWQPQLPFVAVQDGARAMFLPTNSSHSLDPRQWRAQAFWRDITRFHALLLTSYTVFVNRVGVEGSLHFWGGSHVVDPWGEVVAEATEDEEALLVVDLDLAAVRRRRKEFPLVKEARLALLEREIRRLADEGGDL